MKAEQKATEKAILGYMILPDLLDSKRLETKHFSSESHKDIFKAIGRIKKRGDVVDYSTLASELKGKVASSYIISLHDGLPLGLKTGQSNYYFQSHINKLFQINKEQEIKRLVSKCTEEPDFIPQLQEILSDYRPEEPDLFKSFSVASKVEDLKELIKQKQSGELWGLKTCFDKLNQALNGLREITIFSAKPKTGKSTFALQLASSIKSNEGAGVIYYDFENGIYNLMIRLLCQKFNVAYRENILTKAERPELVEGAFHRLVNDYKNFLIVNDRSLTIGKIQNHVTRLKKQSGEDRAFIVIDSLQKLPLESLKDRRAAIDKWLRDFEGLKRDVPDLAILLISELSRAGQKPKESGDIEYTGHFLLKLENNRSEEEIKEIGDDYIRNLYLEYARDVQAGITIAQYEADFDCWKFKEIE